MTTLSLHSAQARSHWRWPLACTAVLMLLVALVYRDTAVAMVTIWMRSETYTHAFVVPPIVAWLIWRRRTDLLPLQPRPAPWMLLPLAGLACLWWLGHLVTVAAAMQLALVAMLVCCVPIVLGWQVSWVLLFPLAFAFFAVPIGEFLTPMLMHWTVEVLVAGLRLSGIPVYQEGQQLVIPSGRWAVIEACSGIRYLMATFMVGSLFAYLNYSSARKRLVFVAVSVVLPVVANWVRAYIIVMLGHISNNEIATGVDHLVYGWVFFGIVILGLFFIGARWADRAVPADVGAQATAGPWQALPAWQPLAVTAAAALLMLWPTWMDDNNHADLAASRPKLVLPAALGDWRGEAMPDGGWTPHVPTATMQQARRYHQADRVVGVHLAYYRGQVGDVKLVSSANHFLDPRDHHWVLLSHGTVQAAAGAVPAAWRQVEMLAAEQGGQPPGARQRLTVWRLYWVGGHLAQGDIHAKLLQAWLALRGQPDDGASIHLVSYLPDTAQAQAQLSDFVRENFGMLADALVQTRDSR